MKGDFS